MSSGLRLSLIFTVACWLTVLIGLILLPCGHPVGLALVLGVGPAGTVGCVATYIEWKSERERADADADDRDVSSVG
jgi:cyanate permease